MFVPVAVIIIVAIIYIYHQDKLRDEVSSLRDDIQNLDLHNSHNNYDYETYNYEPIDKKDSSTDKDEYTFQESQDRAKLGVVFDASAETIKKAYYKIRKEGHNVNFLEIHDAYKRLVEIETRRAEKKLKNVERVTEEKEYDDEDSVIIICGACGKQNRQKRNQGEITVTCPNCQRISKIVT